MRWLLLLALCAPASAQRTLDEVVNALAAVRRFSDVAISPDGRRVAWVEDVHGSNGEATGSTSLYAFELNQPGAKPQRISGARGTNPQTHDSAPVWSPDSSSLLFLSDAARTGELQVYLWRVAGTARKLTSVV